MRSPASTSVSAFAGSASTVPPSRPNGPATEGCRSSALRFLRTFGDR
jgi:hypothetical protein